MTTREIELVKDIAVSLRRIAEALEDLTNKRKDDPEVKRLMATVMGLDNPDPPKKKRTKAEAILPWKKIATVHLLKLFELSPTYGIYDEIKTRQMDGKLTKDQVKLFKHLVSELGTGGAYVCDEPVSKQQDE